MLSITQKIILIAGSLVGAIATIVVGTTVNDVRWYLVSSAFLGLATDLWFLMFTQRGNTYFLIGMMFLCLVPIVTLSGGLIAQLIILGW